MNKLTIIALSALLLSCGGGTSSTPPSVGGGTPNPTPIEPDPTPIVTTRSVTVTPKFPSGISSVTIEVQEQGRYTSLGQYPNGRAAKLTVPLAATSLRLSDPRGVFTRTVTVASKEVHAGLSDVFYALGETVPSLWLDMLADEVTSVKDFGYDIYDQYQSSGVIDTEEFARVRARAFAEDKDVQVDFDFMPVMPVVAKLVSNIFTDGQYQFTVLHEGSPEDRTLQSTTAFCDDVAPCLAVTETVTELEHHSGYEKVFTVIPQHFGADTFEFSFSYGELEWDSTAYTGTSKFASYRVRIAEKTFIEDGYETPVGSIESIDFLTNVHECTGQTPSFSLFTGYGTDDQSALYQTDFDTEYDPYGQGDTYVVLYDHAVSDDKDIYSVFFLNKQFIYEEPKESGSSVYGEWKYCGETRTTEIPSIFHPTKIDVSYAQNEVTIIASNKDADRVIKLSTEVDWTFYQRGEPVCTDRDYPLSAYTVYDQIPLKGTYNPVTGDISFVGIYGDIERPICEFFVNDKISLEVSTRYRDRSAVAEIDILPHTSQPTFDETYLDSEWTLWPSNEGFEVPIPTTGWFLGSEDDTDHRYIRKDDYIYDTEDGDEKLVFTIKGNGVYELDGEIVGQIVQYTSKGWNWDDGKIVDMVVPVDYHAEYSIDGETVPTICVKPSGQFEPTVCRLDLAGWDLYGKDSVNLNVEMTFNHGHTVTRSQEIAVPDLGFTTTAEDLDLNWRGFRTIDHSYCSDDKSDYYCRKGDNVSEREYKICLVPTQKLPAGYHARVRQIGNDENVQQFRDEHDAKGCPEVLAMYAKALVPPIDGTHEYVIELLNTEDEVVESESFSITLDITPPRAEFHDQKIWCDGRPRYINLFNIDDLADTSVVRWYSGKYNFDNPVVVKEWKGADITSVITAPSEGDVYQSDVKWYGRYILPAETLGQWYIHLVDKKGNTSDLRPPLTNLSDYVTYPSWYVNQSETILANRPYRPYIHEHWIDDRETREKHQAQYATPSYTEVYCNDPKDVFDFRTVWGVAEEGGFVLPQTEEFSFWFGRIALHHRNLQSTNVWNDSTYHHPLNDISFMSIQGQEVPRGDDPDDLFPTRNKTINLGADCDDCERFDPDIHDENSDFGKEVFNYTTYTLKTDLTDNPTDDGELTESIRYNMRHVENIPLQLTATRNFDPNKNTTESVTVTEKTTGEYPNGESCSFPELEFISNHDISFTFENFLDQYYNFYGLNATLFEPYKWPEYTYTSKEEVQPGSALKKKTYTLKFHFADRYWAPAHIKWRWTAKSDGVLLTGIVEKTCDITYVGMPVVTLDHPLEDGALDRYTLFGTENTDANGHKFYSTDKELKFNMSGIAKLESAHWVVEVFNGDEVGHTFERDALDCCGGNSMNWHNHTSGWGWYAYSDFAASGLPERLRTASPTNYPDLGDWYIYPDRTKFRYYVRYVVDGKTYETSSRTVIYDGYVDGVFNRVHQGSWQYIDHPNIIGIYEGMKEKLHDKYTPQVENPLRSIFIYLHPRGLGRYESLEDDDGIIFGTRTKPIAVHRFLTFVGYAGQAARQGLDGCTTQVGIFDAGGNEAKVFDERPCGGTPESTPLGGGAVYIDFSEIGGSESNEYKMVVLTRNAAAKENNIMPMSEAKTYNVGVGVTTEKLEQYGITVTWLRKDITPPRIVRESNFFEDLPEGQIRQVKGDSPYNFDTRAWVAPICETQCRSYAPTYKANTYEYYFDGEHDLIGKLRSEHSHIGIMHNGASSEPGFLHYTKGDGSPNDAIFGYTKSTDGYEDLPEDFDFSNPVYTSPGIYLPQGFALQSECHVAIDAAGNMDAKCDWLSEEWDARIQLTRLYPGVTHISSYHRDDDVTFFDHDNDGYPPQSFVDAQNQDYMYGYGQERFCPVGLGMAKTGRGRLGDNPFFTVYKRAGTPVDESIDFPYGTADRGAKGPYTYWSHFDENVPPAHNYMVSNYEYPYMETWDDLVSYYNDEVVDDKWHIVKLSDAVKQSVFDVYERFYGKDRWRAIRESGWGITTTDSIVMRYLLLYKGSRDFLVEAYGGNRYPSMGSYCGISMKE